MKDDLTDFSDVDDVDFTDDLDLFSEKLYGPGAEDDEEIVLPVSSIIDDSVDNPGSADLCADINTASIPATLDEIELQIDRLKQRWGEFTYLIGQRLKYIRDNALFKEKGYNDFKTYVTIAIKMSENNAYYYMSVFDYFTEEQTRVAGSKLKLVIPMLNRINRDTTLSEDVRKQRVADLRDELYNRIYNRSYREAEKVIKEVKNTWFTPVEKVTAFKRFKVSKDRITIFETDPEIQKQLVERIEKFYK
jgi:hypothetical protein